MEKAHTCLTVEPNMLEAGLMINKMALEKKLGQIKLFTKVSIRMVKNMERENSYGLMIVHMKANF